MHQEAQVVSSVGGGRPTVVVYGGSGFFGRLVVADLLAHTDAAILNASRHPRLDDWGPHQVRVGLATSDIRDLAATRRLVRGAALVICAIGPYQGLSLNLLRACIDERVDYVDVADDRDFVARAYGLRDAIVAAGISAFVGCSVVPGFSSLLTRLALQHVEWLERVRIFITPGTQLTRGPGSFASLLATLGEPYPAPHEGGQRLVAGWTERERVAFPPPLNERLVYSVIDVADYFTQPLYFGTPTVTFKIGCEIDILNRCLAACRIARRALHLRSSDRLIPLFRRIISLAAPLGTSQGALLVEISGWAGGAARTVRYCVYKEHGGEIIPAVLPAIAAQAVLRGEARAWGVVPLPDWIDARQLRSKLAARGVQLTVQTDGEGSWTPYLPSKWGSS